MPKTLYPSHKRRAIQCWAMKPLAPVTVIRDGGRMGLGYAEGILAATTSVTGCDKAGSQVQVMIGDV